MDVIKPTPGRILEFHPAGELPEHSPCVAMITHVHSDRCINIAAWDSNGAPIMTPPTSVQLLQPGDGKPLGGFYCDWPEHIRRQHAAVNTMQTIQKAKELWDKTPPAPEGVEAPDQDKAKPTSGDGSQGYAGSPSGEAGSSDGPGGGGSAEAPMYSDPDPKDPAESEVP